MNQTPTFFLLFRRGIPLIGFLALQVISWIYPASFPQVWAGIVGMLVVMEFALTFQDDVVVFAKRGLVVRWEGYWVKMLRPLFKMLNLEERWLLSFCAWNNKCVLNAFRYKKASSAIVLLPHCIQMSSCKAQVANDLQSCLGCGKCTINSIADAAKEHKWDARIVPRSHVAYDEARESRPNIVIAVACPDRLVKGLTKLPETPSYAIPLELPHGMCADTTFDFQRLLQAMGALVEAAPSTEL